MEVISPASTHQSAYIPFLQIFTRLDRLFTPGVVYAVFKYSQPLKGEPNEETKFFSDFAGALCGRMGAGIEQHSAPGSTTRSAGRRGTTRRTPWWSWPYG